MKQTYEFDLIIAGGGISGACAGISAAREGIRTLIIEQQGFLGGMLTAAGVGPMMTFHAGDTQVIRGIPGELIERLSSRGLSPGHITDSTGYTYTVTPFDMEGMKIELESMFLEAGGRLLYHTMLGGVNTVEVPAGEGETDSCRITEITICNKAGISVIAAPFFIDATGDGDLSAWSGVDYLKGRESDGESQPMTMKMRMGGVDIPRIKAYIHAHPEEFPRLKGDTSLIDRAPRLSIGGFVETLRRAREVGEISFAREDVLFFETNNTGEVIINTSRIQGLDATVPADLTLGEIEGRRQVRELVEFLRRRIPGFENAILEFTGPSVGVRSSRQIKGIYTITGRDVLESRKFSDSVACSGYPIDIHSPTGNSTDSDFLAWGDFYTIPYRALINPVVENLITVGRCISAEFDAQGSFRTTPCAGAIGHAGGAASAAAVKSGIPFNRLAYGQIQDILLKQNAFLG